MKYETKIKTNNRNGLFIKHLLYLLQRELGPILSHNYKDGVLEVTYILR